MSGVKRWGLVAGLVALTLAPAACAATQTDATSGQVQPTGSATRPGNQTASGSPMPSGTGTVSPQDAQFLQAAHQINLTEIAASKLAQQKNVNQQLKDLAGRFVTDHTRLDQSVQQTASKVGVTLPGAPSNDQQNLVNQMQGLNGRDFETRWVTTQLVWHAAALQLGQSELAQGSDAQAQRVAQDAAPVLQTHHDALLALARNLGIAIPTGTPGAPGATPSETAGTPSPSETAGTPSPSETAGSPSPTSTEETPSESQTE